jgi:predicted AAA+ superfamily ATPase
MEASDSEKFTNYESFRNYIFAGSFPASVFLEKEEQERSAEFLEGVISALIEKDIYQKHEIENKEAFQKIIDFLLDSTGSQVSPNSISKSLMREGIRIDSRTVDKYLSYLTETFMFYKANRYEIKGKGLLQTLNKYYAVDAGIRRVRLSRKRDDDLGHMLESAVYLKLKRRYKNVFIGKVRDKEVDFVAIKSNATPVYYQVSYNTSDEKTLEREISALAAIKDFYPKILLTMDGYLERTHNGIKVIYAKDWFGKYDDND